MTFHEKLRNRVAELGLNKARTAREVGLPESTISSYLSKDESLPRIDIALKLARAIKVPLEWLADDEQVGSPPAQPTDSAIQNVPEGFLMREVCRRLRLASMDVRDLIDKAERVDWRDIINQLLSQPTDSPFPRSLDHEIRIASSLFFADSSLLKFEASYAMKAHWRELPPIEMSEDDLDSERLRSQLRTLNHGTYCGAAQFYLFLLATEDERTDPAKINDARDKLRAELEKLDGLSAAKRSSPQSRNKPPSRK